MTFPLAFGECMADKKALDIIRHVRRIRLPGRGWATLPSWKDLQQAEIRRILENEGEEAFVDKGSETRDANGRGKLLRRRFKGGGEVVLELTTEAERALQIREGLRRGFRYLDAETGEEHFVRIFQVGGGFLRAGLSWFGMAGPWVEGWRRKLQGQTVASTPHCEDLSAERPERLDQVFPRVQILEDGLKIMEAALAQVGRQGRNPVRIPAIVFRVLLQLENNKDWKTRVEAGLNALRACTFIVDSFDMQKLKGSGTFLGEWWYRGAGHGAHGDGAYFLDIQPGFVGCLSVFESGNRKLSLNRDLKFYDFSKKLRREDRRSLRFTKIDAGRPFYNAAASLTTEEQNFVAFLQREITVCKDPARKDCGNIRERSTAPNADARRLYGHDFCPLLPTGTLYHAALGHFKNCPETGRTLCGTLRRGDSAHVGRRGGLLQELGFAIPSGLAHIAESVAVRKTLKAFKVVVMDYLEGAVVARGPDGHWLAFEEASRLPGNALCQRTKWFFFLPEDWKELRRKKWEAHMQQRAARGEIPHAWKVTEDLQEAERSHLALVTNYYCRPEVENNPSGGTQRRGLRNSPLQTRFRAARIDRGLSQVEVGRLFGVSQKTVSQWERSAYPDEEGGVQGDPIPPEMVPLIHRWVETGEAPTAEELASRHAWRSQGDPTPSHQRAN